MKNGIKSRNLPGKLQQLMEKRKSSSNTKDDYPSPAKTAGSRAGESERPLNTSLYEVYDSCYTCPLPVYIDATVDDKLERLIISGHPPREYLEAIKMKLVYEFSELSASGESQALADAASSYYKQLCMITGLETALKLVFSGRFEKAIPYLNGSGVKCSLPGNGDELTALIGKIDMKLKNRLAKLKEISSRYEALSAKGEKPTRRNYNKLLITLSTCEAVKIQLNPKQMTVAEFAEYLNLFNEYQNLLKIKQNGRKH